MVSASIVDDQGRKGHSSPSASNNITFSIVTGPGQIIGVGNGDPFCHEPKNKALWRSAHHGLARVFVQVTENAASSSHERKTTETGQSRGKNSYKNCTPRGYLS